MMDTYDPVSRIADRIGNHWLGDQKEQRVFWKMMDTYDPVSRIADRIGNQKSKEFFGIGWGIKSSGTWKRRLPKVGRNEPCPCGSGKKFKKCCQR